MNNLPKLTDAICEAFASGLPGQKWEPKDGVTHCNEAVNYVATKTGYPKFSGMMANQMFRELQTNGDFLEVPPDSAQFHANQGVLVIGAWANPAGDGHVVIVRPGEAVKSESWGTLAPKILNIGRKNFIDLPASYAFTKDEMPKFFALKTML